MNVPSLATIHQAKTIVLRAVAVMLDAFVDETEGAAEEVAMFCDSLPLPAYITGRAGCPAWSKKRSQCERWRGAW